MRFDDQIINLCADIDTWMEELGNENTTTSCNGAVAMLLRSRSLLKDLARRDLNQTQ
jgi:hypothetical protein